MSDEYIAASIEAELAETCPGDKKCHGCVGWCPLCGDTGHVCDDPDCDTHRRDTDVLKDISELEGLARLYATECQRWEVAVLVEPKMERSRRELRTAASNFAMYEKDLTELEEELEEVRRPWSFLVPRPPGVWKYRNR